MITPFIELHVSLSFWWVSFRSFVEDDAIAQQVCAVTGVVSDRSATQ